MKKKQKILIILIVAAIIQIIIISYNHFKGILTLDSALEFFVRLTYGTALSALLITALYFINSYLIKRLNVLLPWNNKTTGRIAAEFTFSIIIAVAGAFSITLISHIFFPYPEGYWQNAVNNSLILSVLNFIFLISLEGYYYFIEWNKLKYESERLEKENAIAKYNILKSQINPHFLFNSLSVLSNIIDSDPEEADEFISKLSHIYRYVTDKLDKPAVTVSEELEFARSYVELQQMRHIDKIIFGINIDSSLLNRLIVPMSMQIVLENCFRHNLISIREKLEINIYSYNSRIIIRNNYRPKETNRPAGIGIQNLKGRYELVSGEKPDFYVKNGFYYSELPLIEEE